LLGSLLVLWQLSPVRLGRPEAEETAEWLVGLSFHMVGWWADPIAALVVAAFSVRAGRRLRHKLPVPALGQRA
jgi:hypothetical protein